MNSHTSMLFVDNRVKDFASLLVGLGPGVEVVMLDPAQDGLSEMAAAVAGRTDIDAIHVVSHGAKGVVQLGNLDLSANNVAAHAADLATIGQALSADGDIVLYGCDTGAGASGAALVQALATLTGADVAASNDLTGATSLGGDWVMEVHAGTIEATLPFSAQALQNFHGTLGTGTVLEPVVANNHDTNVGIALLNNGGHVDVYLHQVGGDNNSNIFSPGNPPQYTAKMVVTDASSVNSVPLAITSGSAYVLDASVAKLENGGFVVGWTEDSSVAHDYSSRAMYYQIFDNSGNALGTAQPLASVDGMAVSLTALSGGGFAAAYTSFDLSPNSPEGILGLDVYSYNAGTFARAQETLVGGYTNSAQTTFTNGTDANVQLKSVSANSAGHASVIQLSDGSIVVTDSTGIYNSSTSTYGVYAYKFTSAGIAANFTSGYSTQRINWSTTLDTFSGQHAIALSGGGFAVVSLDSYSYNNSHSYELSVYDNGGTVLAPATPTTRTVVTDNNMTTASKSYYAEQIAAASPSTYAYLVSGFGLTESSDGHILVALPTNNNSGLAIYTYTSAGAQVGSAVDSGISPASGYAIDHPVLAPAANGGFAVSYDDFYYDSVNTGYMTAAAYIYGSPYSGPANVTPTFIASTSTASMAQNGTALSLESLLHASDSDSAQTLTWSQNLAPTHGTLSFSSATGASGSADIAPGGAITYTPTAGYAGTDSFTVQVSDGVATTTRVITVNVAPPAPSAPDLDASSDTGASATDNVTKAAALSFSGTGGAGDSASTVRVFIDTNNNGSYDAGTDISDTATMSNGAWTVGGLSTSTLSDGVYHVYAVTTSATGSLTSPVSSALNVTIDKTAPTVTLSGLALSADTGVVGDFITKIGAQIISATLSAPLSNGEMLYGSLNGGNSWTDITSMVTGTALAWNPVVLSGDRTMALRVGDPAGNFGTMAMQGYYVDTIAPAAPVITSLSARSDSGTVGDGITNVTTPVVTGTGENGATVTLYDYGSSAVLGTAVVASGAWSITSATLSGGAHDLVANQTDVAGNISLSSPAPGLPHSFALGIDTTAPTAIALSNQAIAVTAGLNAVVGTLSNTDAVHFGTSTYALVPGVGSTNNAAYTISNGVLSMTDPSTASVGTESVRIRVTDAAGNSFEQALQIDVRPPGPVVSAIVRAANASADAQHNATTVDFTVTFSEAVTGVDSTDFTVTGNVPGTVSNLVDSGDGIHYLVTIQFANTSVDGTLGLALKSSGTNIENSLSQAITGGYTGSQTYTIDHTTPVMSSAPLMTPGTDTGASQTDNITSNTTPTFTGTAEIGTTVELHDANFNLLGTAVADGTGHYSITVGTPMAAGSYQLSTLSYDAAGNASLVLNSTRVVIDNVAPTAISLSNSTVITTAGANAVVGTLNNTDAIHGGTSTYQLVAGAGDTNNSAFTIVNGVLKMTDPLAAGVAVESIRVQVTDAAGNSYVQALQVNVTAPPPEPDPVPTVDGVPVTSTPVTLPGGGSGTQISIPIVTDSRSESSGTAGVADIPLVTSGTSNLLLAQVASGYGLSSTGGASQPAGSSTEHLIQAIIAATPNNPASDQSHLTGNGVTFLNKLASSVPLLVETITPTSGAAAPNGAVTLTGTSTDQQHTALVIDASHLPAGSQLVLNSVDFAAVVGAVSVTGNTAGQILTGDQANQQFTVSGGSGSSVFSGGGNDTLLFKSSIATGGVGGVGGAMAASVPGTTILHGGTGNDIASFSGASSAYTVENHDGYLVVTAKAQPGQHAVVVNAEQLKFSDVTVAVDNRDALTSIAGLYQSVLGRQADYLGMDFWGTAQKNGVSLGTIALSMMASAESQGAQAVQFNGNAAHDVELLYQGLFSRHSDAAGLAFWSDKVEHGMALQQVADVFLHAPEATQHQIAAVNWDFLV